MCHETPVFLGGFRDFRNSESVIATKSFKSLNSLVANRGEMTLVARLKRDGYRKSTSSMPG